jgi:hypothetical protein
MPSCITAKAVFSLNSADFSATSIRPPVTALLKRSSRADLRLLWCPAAGRLVLPVGVAVSSGESVGGAKASLKVRDICSVSTLHQLHVRTAFIPQPGTLGSRLPRYSDLMARSRGLGGTRGCDSCIQTLEWADRLRPCVVPQALHWAKGGVEGSKERPPCCCLVDGSLCSGRLVSCSSACLASFLVPANLALSLALVVLVSEGMPLSLHQSDVKINFHSLPSIAGRARDQRFICGQEPGQQRVPPRFLLALHHPVAIPTT